MESHHHTPYHPTDLELYQMCPEKYFLAHDKDVDPAFTPWPRLKGTIIHEALANPGKYDDIREIVYRHLENLTVPLNVPRDQVEKEIPDMDDQVDMAFEYRIKTLRAGHSDPSSKEVSLQFRVADFRFECTLDLIIVHADTPEGMVEVWDYKTGRKWDYAQMNRKLQFGLYYLACGQNGMKVNRLFWAQTPDLIRRKRTTKNGKAGDARGQFLYPIYIGPDDMAMVQTWTQELLWGIHHGIRYPSPYAPCGSCEYHHVCPKFKIGVQGGRSPDQYDAAMSEQERFEREILFGGEA